MSPEVIKLERMRSRLALATASYSRALADAVCQRDLEEIERAFDEADRLQREVIVVAKRVRRLEAHCPAADAA
jgi:hypothetical protein